MRITGAEISGFIHFKFSRIRKLTIAFTSPLQVIIGTNGSGKSRLLKELTLAVPARRDYDPDGYKILYVEHHGSQYVLKTDFTKHGSPHSFIKDGEEQNEGGTTGVQTELIRMHFGFTEEVEKISTIGYKLTAMGPTQRRALLMNLSPYELGFMLDYHKKVTSKIRVCKNNIVRLTERKALLEGSLLSNDDVAVKRAIATDLERKISEIIETTYKIQAKIDVLPVFDPSVQAFTEDDLAPFKKELRAYTRKYLNIAGMLEKSDAEFGVETQRLAALRDQATLRAEKSSIINRLAEIARDIDEKQTTLENLGSEGDAETHLAKIRSLDLDISQLSPRELESPWSQISLRDIGEVLPILESKLVSLIECTVRLLSSAQIRRKRSALQYWTSILQNCEHDIPALKEHIQGLVDSQTIRLSDIPEDNCAQFKCPLYQSFHKKQGQLTTTLTRLQKQLANLERKSMRISRYVEKQREQLQALDVYLPTIQDIIDILNRYGELRQLLRGVDIIANLQHNPINLWYKIKDTFDRSEDTHRLRAMRDERTVAQVSYDKCMQVADTVRKNLVDLISRQSKEHTDLRWKLSRVEQQEREATARIEAINFHSVVEHKLQMMSDDLEVRGRYARTKYEREVYEDALHRLAVLKRESVSELGNINHLLREQESLRARYDNEVVGELTALEKEQKEWVALEEALSPNSGIPHAYAAAFINALIDTENAYLRKVFSYPFKLKRVDVEQPLDYEFSALVDDVPVPKIGECSDGQSDFLNLGFCLALFRQLHLNEFPIYLDEVGRAFDQYHKQQLLTLLRHIIDDGHVSQMFLINHDVVIHEGLVNAEVLVLDDRNIVTPATYNTHVQIER